MSVNTDNRVGVKLSLEAAIGQLSETLDGVRGTMDKIHKFLTPNPRHSPIVRPLQATGVSDGSTYYAIDLGGPSSGRLWDVRRVGVWAGGGTDPFPTVANVTVGLVKIQGGQPSNRGFTQAPAFFDMALAPSTVPNDADFSIHQLQVKPGEHLMVLLKGTSNAQQYMVSGQAEEYLESVSETVVA
jgi:hypothetical protein